MFPRQFPKFGAANFGNWQRNMKKQPSAAANFGNCIVNMKK
jgi:hypothetical protein